MNQCEIQSAICLDAGRNCRGLKSTYNQGVILSTFLLSLFLSVQQIPSGRHCIEAGKGQFLIFAGTGGLFGAFAHDHTIEAKEISGCVQVDGANLARSSVELTFPANKIKVLDPKASATDRTKIQQQMETDVLRIQQFPSIQFRSTAMRLAPGKESQITVDGQLTIRDRTRPVSIPLQVARTPDGSIKVTGQYSFRQTAFGIKPVQVMGGTVRVKDELRVRFELYLK